MNYKTVLHLCVGAIILIVLGDIFLALDAVNGNTISEAVRTMHRGYVALLAGGIGAICSHWWWTPSQEQIREDILSQQREEKQ